ncbi:uncharacterized protein LOC127805581 [Diospyros lotus]|uniref:uncharacterized protein LOC127805581 n=1 Tax=Diospyros lotus TaxID=55363 RepID=UPI00224DE89F|nr:uncharacterized protein LOC127805581 [Diospyros lotus]
MYDASEESFRVDYFLYVVDQALFSLKCRLTKFLKVEIDKILPSINNVTRKVEWIGDGVY